MSRPRRNIALTLTPDEWDRLVRAALADDRDPYQQARVLLLRGLGIRAARESHEEDSTAA
ncbi:MAG TPA: hypothetical protein VF076_07270 [Acidimicrobiales bacterium]